MLNRQIQVKISLLGLTGTANVKQVFPHAVDEINFVGHSLGNFVFGVLLFSNKSICAAPAVTEKYRFVLN